MLNMSDVKYFSGFGSHFESEAVTGALPIGQNSPKEPLLGLYPEQLSGSAFTMSRWQNLRSWLYRIKPSVAHKPFETYRDANWFAVKKNHEPTNPNQMRWQPLPPPKKDCHFIQGIQTMVTTVTKPGCAVHHYACNQPMDREFFYNADGELVIIPEKGALQLWTEFGEIEIEPQEIAVVPRGVKFQVNPKSSGWSRGYVGENTGRPFILPDLGPLGANALANPRDFKYPQAKFFKQDGDFKLIAKFDDCFWQADMDSHPLDVVAWHGNYAPYKYDLRLFNTMGSVSYDHPDPSIYTVLTSPSTVPGQANCDFVIFPPRWLVAEQTFRPPYYHRNMMNEYMGLIHGAYDAKEGGGFVPGGSSLHNCMSGHGPDAATFAKAIQNPEEPQKVGDTMAFMFETSEVFHPTALALETPSLDKDYFKCWQDLEVMFKGN